MLVIFPNQVTALSSEDRDFIVATLAGTSASRAGLQNMLGDPESLEIILDNQRLYEANVRRILSLDVPSQVDFYLLLRPALQRVGVDDREVARYLSALLTSFTYAERTPDILPREAFQVNHLANLTKTLRNTTEEGRFMVLAYMGNYALIMASLFPEKLPYRSEEKGRPDLEYCDKLGRASFQAASHHRLAWEYMVGETFQALYRHYRQVRIALHDLAEQGIFSGEPA